MKEFAGLCAEIEESIEFLVDRQGQYSHTDKGLVFQRAADSEAFTKQMEKIQQTQRQVAARMQKLSSHLNDSR